MNLILKINDSLKRGQLSNCKESECNKSKSVVERSVI